MSLPPSWICNFCNVELSDTDDKCDCPEVEEPPPTPPSGECGHPMYDLGFAAGRAAGLEEAASALNDLGCSDFTYYADAIRALVTRKP